MAYDKIEYNANYTKTKYDTFNVRVPKGHKEKIEQFRRMCDFPSLNAYINKLIQDDMNVLEKKLKSLSGEEQFIINCYRYANEDQKRKLTNTACEIDNKLSIKEKEKLYNLRKKAIEIEIAKEWHIDKN